MSRENGACNLLFFLKNAVFPCGERRFFWASMREARESAGIALCLSIFYGGVATFPSVRQDPVKNLPVRCLAILFAEDASLHFRNICFADKMSTQQFAVAQCEKCLAQTGAGEKISSRGERKGVVKIHRRILRKKSKGGLRKRQAHVAWFFTAGQRVCIRLVFSALCGYFEPAYPLKK